jgi:hypothetical protein
MNFAHQKQTWAFQPAAHLLLPPDDLNLRLSGKSSRLNVNSLNQSIGE